MNSRSKPLTTTASAQSWVEVAFNGTETINEIDVFTLQDNYESSSNPTDTMTFTQRSWEQQGVAEVYVQRHSDY